MKPAAEAFDAVAAEPFSILERIDVGETLSDNDRGSPGTLPFSILERIDVGETLWWPIWYGLPVDFQYPRTDRRG